MPVRHSSSTISQRKYAHTVLMQALPCSVLLVI